MVHCEEEACELSPSSLKGTAHGEPTWQTSSFADFMVQRGCAAGGQGKAQSAGSLATGPVVAWPGELGLGAVRTKVGFIFSIM